MSKAQGKVWLVGAGPGDPELLTCKALRLLEEADVVLHDDLVSDEILALIPRTTKTYNVGKRCGQKLIQQEQISSLLVSFAQFGLKVVRLKSGDPMIFLQRPISLGLLMASVALCVLVMLPAIRSRREEAFQEG